MTPEKQLDHALRLTEIHKQYKDAHPALREAYFLRALYPEPLCEMI